MQKILCSVEVILFPVTFKIHTNAHFMSLRQCLFRTQFVTMGNSKHAGAGVGVGDMNESNENEGKGNSSKNNNNNNKRSFKVGCQLKF